MDGMSKSCTENFLEVSYFLKSRGVLRARDLHAIGVTEADIRRLVGRGSITRVARGVYTSRRVPATLWRALAVAAVRVPVGVVCLESALWFHGLIDTAPTQVWMALPNKAWRPRIDEFPVRFAWFSGAAATTDVEVHDIEGVDVRIFGATKSVIDCVRHRAVVGVPPAEVVRRLTERDSSARHRLTELAELCRVLGPIGALLPE